MKKIKNFQDLWDNFSQNLNANLFSIWCYPYARGMYNEFIYFNEICKSKKRTSNYMYMGKEDSFSIQYLIEEYRKLPEHDKKVSFYIPTNNNIGPFIVPIVGNMYIHKRVRRVKVDKPENIIWENDDSDLILKKEEVFFLSPNLTAVKDWLLYWANDLDKSDRGCGPIEEHYIGKIIRDINNSL